MTQAASSLTVFHSPHTRSQVAVWMLEELGLPYEIKITDIRAGAHKTPEYLAINPMGKVPALRDGAVIVSEYSAICLYLADKYAPGRLAPAFDAPERGEFLRWMFFAGGCIEPALIQGFTKWEVPASNAAWGSYDQVMSVLRDGVSEKQYLLGDTFTAADVVVGSGAIFGIQFKLIQNQPAIQAYVDRLTARPAYQRSRAIDANAPGAYNPAA